MSTNKTHYGSNSSVISVELHVEFKDLYVDMRLLISLLWFPVSIIILIDDGINQSGHDRYILVHH